MTTDTSSSKSDNSTAGKDYPSSYNPSFDADWNYPGDEDFRSVVNPDNSEARDYTRSEQDLKRREHDIANEARLHKERYLSSAYSVYEAGRIVENEFRDRLELERISGNSRAHFGYKNAWDAFVSYNLDSESENFRQTTRSMSKSIISALNKDLKKKYGIGENGKAYDEQYVRHLTEMMDLAVGLPDSIRLTIEQNSKKGGNAK